MLINNLVCYIVYIHYNMNSGVDIIQSDFASSVRLIYETNTPDFEGNAFGSEIRKKPRPNGV